MIVDGTDNDEYFIYKNNISNNDKKRKIFLSNSFYKNLKKDTFTEKNLWKIFYLEGKNHLNDLINFKLFENKKSDKKLIKLKEFFQTKEIPKFEIKANTLIDKYHYKEGKDLGNKLSEIEEFWIENSFKISDKDLEKIVKN